ncbi:MAG TPA: DNA alkylation repair protein [Pyrinomonadaceae bacterium]|nr:DNA alkylation repair protein [Pyrinomonadaceae bacterium]HNU09463.1 DNA alkylation repair protein [Pyrinomonadaceae bacterium]
MHVDEIIRELESLGNPDNVAGMARYGIVTKRALGVAAPELRALAKRIKKVAADRHSLALELWQTGIHEARAIAFLIDDPKLVTPEQMDAWAADFDNWAICDSTCGNLFSYTPFAYEKAYEWAEIEEEFVKRAGIVLMAWLAVHDKKISDDVIAEFIPVLESKADDDRNFIKKAVNWSLRSIGKRSIFLHEKAVESAIRIREKGTRSARWIASDALRELMNERTIERIKRRVRR